MTITKHLGASERVNEAVEKVERLRTAVVDLEVERDRAWQTIRGIEQVLVEHDLEVTDPLSDVIMDVVVEMLEWRAWADSIPDDLPESEEPDEEPDDDEDEEPTRLMEQVSDLGEPHG